jgi:hypothetical protein
MLNREYTFARPWSFGFFANSRSAATVPGREIARLRNLIWLYFWLLIFEGALRKWTLTSLSAPLLLIRDPVVLLIYARALRDGRFPISRPIVTCFLLFACFVLLAVVQINAGIGGGPFVVLYGLRTYFLHLPLIFIIPSAFTRSDVLKVGKWILLLSVPMAALMVLQYLSAPGSFINAATIADGQQISFAMGKIRPAGTFSFATGAAHFFVLATSFLIYALVEGGRIYPRWLLVAALFGIAIAQPVSGSRLLVLGCALELVAAILFAVLDPSRGQQILGVAALLAAVAAILSQSSFFREALDVFMKRWDSANASGGIREGLVWRFFGGFLEPFTSLQDAEFLGKGIGMGTNAASAITTGKVQFLLAEGEWARIVLEAGPLLGFSFLLYRVCMAGTIAARALWAAGRGQLLPWLLAWAAVRGLLTEQTSQPTNLGFMVLAAGLCLAAMPSTELTCYGFAYDENRNRGSFPGSFNPADVAKDSVCGPTIPVPYTRFGEEESFPR